MTRDEEIEALAMQRHVAWSIEYNRRTGDWPSEEEHVAEFDEHIAIAEGAVSARDRWRTTRAASAPEKTTPEPRIEDSAEELAEEIAGRLFDGYAALGKLDQGSVEARVVMRRKHVEHLIRDAIRAHAEALKAQQAHEGSDGS